MSKKLYLLNFHCQHSEAMAGSNSSMVVIAENYKDAKAKVRVSYPECKYTFFDQFSCGRPKLFSECGSGEFLQGCYELDFVDGLEIRVVDK